MTKSAHKYGPDAPLATSARGMLRTRFGAVAERLDALARGGDAEDVHQLRVATRRSAAAMMVFGPWLAPRRAGKTKKSFKKLRRAAGAARECDVHRAQLETLLSGSKGIVKDAIKTAITMTGLESERAHRRLGKAARKWDADALDTMAKKLIAPTRVDKGARLVDAARDALAKAGGDVADASAKDLSVIEGLHAIRLALKRLRYTIEVVEPCLDKASSKPLRKTLSGLQERLGEINDIDGLAARVARYADEKNRSNGGQGVDALRQLADGFVRIRDARSDRFRRWWSDRGAAELTAMLDDLARSIPSGQRAENPSPPTPRPERADSPRRLAAVDVGSNTVRLLVIDVARGGSTVVIDQVRQTRLVEGSEPGRPLNPGAVARTIDAIESLVAEAERQGAEHTRLVATAAVREASNRAEFVQLVRARTGAELEVLTGQAEARLVYRSAASAFDLSRTNAALIDVGGGSTELALSAAGQVVQLGSTPVGAVRFTERFGGAAECAGPRFREMVAAAQEAVQELVGRPAFRPQIMIGAGGTLTSLASMLQARSTGTSKLRPHKYEVRRSDVERIIGRVRGLDVDARRRMPGLDPDRADIILAGLVLVDRLMDRLGVNSVVVSEGGVRDGLAIDMTEHADATHAQSDDPIASAVRLAAACGSDRHHGLHVARLALSMFDALRDPAREIGGLTDRDRVLLEAGALLHDVGEIIGSSGRHKHSAAIIRHADLTGFDDGERKLVALLARYHRKARPSVRHPDFDALAPEQQARVRRLAAILRIAAALDLHHEQDVLRIDVRIRGETAWFTAAAAAEPAPELREAQRRADLFEETYRMHARFGWVRFHANGTEEE